MRNNRVAGCIQQAKHLSVPRKCPVLPQAGLAEAGPRQLLFLRALGFEAPAWRWSQLNRRARRVSQGCEAVPALYHTSRAWPGASSPTCRAALQLGGALQLPGAFIHLRIYRVLFFFPLSLSQHLPLTTPHSYLHLLFLTLRLSAVPLWPLALKGRHEYFFCEQKFSFWPPLEAAASAGCRSRPDQAEVPTDAGCAGSFSARLLVGVVSEGKHRTWQWQETRRRETEDNWGVRERTEEWKNVVRAKDTKAEGRAG